MWAVAAIYLRNLSLNLTILVLSIWTWLLIFRLVVLGFEAVVAGSLGRGHRALVAAGICILIRPA